MSSPFDWRFTSQPLLSLISYYLLGGLFFVGGSILGAFRLANATKKRSPARVA